MSQALEALVVELRADVKGLQTSLKSAASDVSRFSKNAETSVDGFQAAILRARTAVLSLGVAYTAFRVGRSIIDAGVQVQAMQNKMQAATGSALVAADSLSFVREEANRLGLDIRNASDGFAGFAASSLRAGLTLQQTKDIFTGVSEAATSMRLPTEQVSLIFKALEQMAGKGTISMEELRGQLGDALPGAFEIAAKSMGKTTAEFGKMVANGEVMASDFLPKFGSAIRRELGGSVDEASQGAQAAFNRLGNAFFDLQSKMANAGLLDVVTKAVTDLTETLNDPDTVDGLKGFAGMLADIANAALSAASALGTFYGKAEKAIQKAGDSAFAGIFGQEGADAIALARKAKANGVSMDSQKAVDKYMAGGGFKFNGGTVNGEGLTTEGGYVGSAAPVSGGYSLGKVSAGTGSDAAAKAREKAAETAERLKEQMQGKVEDFQYNRANPEEQAALDAENQQKMLKEALEAKAITEQEFRDLGLQAETDYQDRLTEIRTDAADKEIDNRQRAAAQETAIREAAMNNAVALLNVFASKNKAIAIALLVFEKARAIAQALIATHVAATTALIYDPSGASSARVTALGYANVGLIAATGIAELASMGSSGSAGAASSGGSGYYSEGGASGSGTATGKASQAKSVYITLNGDDAAFYSKNMVRKLIESINDAASDGTRLVVAVS